MEATVPPPGSPEQDDLVRLCASLNAEGARYLVVGGMAMNQHGMLRATFSGACLCNAIILAILLCTAP